ncbi:unnamed protein product [Staurois parvus]|uniref:Apoptosis regulator Bcl-2 n=1 Tax=Staurois parvus TaxID=386267 RepID=A0ABN9AZ09_9NEOB|nr:unnamed protein product [Staurois parvus]
MAHPRRGGYDHREIVVKYIHYKLSQRGYDWEEGRHLTAELSEASAAANNNSVNDEEVSATQGGPTGHPPASDLPAASSSEPLPPELFQTLSRAGDEFSSMYQQDFRHISGLLHLTPSTVRLRFAAVVEELFHDGINWGRIVAFFEFGGVMCVESVNREMSPLVDSIVGWMTDYLNRHLQNWIQEQGGWVCYSFIHFLGLRVVWYRGQVFERKCEILKYNSYWKFDSR